MNPSDKALQAASEYAKKHRVCGYGGFDTESWLDLAFLAGVESMREEIKVLRDALKDIEMLPRILHKDRLVDKMQNLVWLALEKVGE